MGHKNPWIAAILSFIFGGLGQAYLGLWWKAIFFFALEVLTGYLYFVSESSLSLVSNLLVSVWSMVDAYQSAKKVQTPDEPEPQEHPELRLF
jgi:TM2 domain-containing membrane protein YozV